MSSKNSDLFNMSLQVYNSSSDVPERGLSEEFGYKTVIGVIIILLINFIVTYEVHSITGTLLTIKINLDTKTVSRIITFTIVLLLFPIIIVVLVLASIYKAICSIIIRNKDENFVKFLDSFDVFWSLENNIGKNLINVVGIIESQSNEALILDIKDRLKNIIPNIERDDREKIFYRRKEEFGFYYWTKYSSVDLDEYVQPIEHPYKLGKLRKSDLEEIMTELSNKPLPYDNEGLFQILITTNPLGFNMNGKNDYGIIFRIHHSVGDGVALVEFLCRTLADGSGSQIANMFSSPESCESNKCKSVKDLIKMIKKVCEIPLCFVNGIIREPDDNSLHGPVLQGITVFKWTESDKNLLLMIKEIKEKIGARFTEILATALSKGLRHYFLKTMSHVPDTVAVVLPIRFPKNPPVDVRLTLKNDFSVTILDLPIYADNDITDIQVRCEKVRNSGDPLTNYYFLNICYILPKQILEPLLNSSQATMVFSNMPGPDMLRICGENLLKSLAFFIPPKGTTGLGVTALCYGGVLRFGVMADKNLLKNPDDISVILDGMMHEIRRLHQLYVEN